jgi:hypothetical protein
MHPLGLALAQSDDCQHWSTPRALDVAFVPTRPADGGGCGGLGSGLALPSYVVRRVAGVTRHEIYWTYGEGDLRSIALVRVISTDGGTTFGAPENVAVFEGDDVPGEPVSVTVAGTSDVVLVAPLGSGAGRTGLELRVATDDEATHFVRLGDTLVEPSGTPGTFDRFQIAAGSIAPTPSGLVLLYGAAGDFHFDPYTQTTGVFSTGTARITFVGFASDMP